MNKKIFIICTLIFFLCVIGFTIHFMSLTTPPWEKRKGEVQNKYKVQYNEKLGLKNIDSLKEARKNK